MAATLEMLALAPGPARASPQNTHPASAEPVTTAVVFKPVDRRSASDVPTDFLTGTEAADLSRLSRHLSDASLAAISQRSQHAVALALAAIAKGADEGDTLYTQALGLLKAGKLDVAVEALRVGATSKALAANQPADAESATEVAGTWRALGSIVYLLDAHQALDAYKKAVAADPRDALSHLAIGAIEIDDEDYDNAKKSLHRALVLAKADPTGLIEVWALEDLASLDLLRQRDSDEAQTLHREARRLIDQHAAADPQNAIWRNELYAVTAQRAAIKQAGGDLAGAAQSTQDEFEIIQALVASDRTNALWQRQISLANSDVGRLQLATGERVKGLVSYKVAVTIAERRETEMPGNRGRMRDLVSVYQWFGVAQGNTRDARIALQKAIAVADKNATLDPSDIGLQRDRSGLYETLGDVDEALGDLAAADEAYRGEFAVLGRLQKVDRGHQNKWRRQLVELLNKMGPIQLKLRDFESAYASFNGNSALISELAADKPTDIWLQGQAYLAKSGLGDVKFNLGDLPGALGAYGGAKNVGVQAAKLDPTNEGTQGDLASIANKIGDVQVAQKAYGAAEDTYRSGLAIRERLAKAHPKDPERSHEVAISYDKIGAVQREANDYTKAAMSEKAALAIFTDLMRANPTNREYQHDVAFSSGVVGLIAVDQGDYDAGVAAFTGARAVLQKIAETNPDDIDAQRDLSVAYANLAGCLMRKGALDKALEIFKEGQAMMRRVAALAPGKADYKTVLDQFDEAIATLQKTSRRSKI